MMLLKFGRFPVVVASSPEMAKQFLKTHDTVFASRPALAAGRPVVLKEQLTHYTLSSISRVVLSNKYFSESGENDDESNIVKLDVLRDMLDEWFLLNGVFPIGDWIPWLSFLDLQGYVGKMKALGRKLDRFLSNVIDDHQAKRTAETEFVPKDMVDLLLQQADDPNLDVKLTSDRVKGLLQDVLVGGTDTSATTIEWTIHELLRHPELIAKVKEELDRVIGTTRWVEEKDVSQLHYLDAVIMESMRLHPLATLLVPRYATEDCEVAGYNISKGTMVLINTWSIGRDPYSWDAPEEFLPERFFDKEIDVLGSNYAMLPFGSGRRRCPGYMLGLKIVRTTLANLLHGFNLKLVDGMRPEDISMEEEYGLTTHPKKPLAIIMEPTLPGYLY
ncbi:hypothetical protein DH2020_012550 [Rehmannia glutinosa]|uniref:Flavonoid 3'-monooxygenase n=1 Tax=Rehmannia glutinosa TaxID=99300 RepID=A0ABR0X273_REHGL